MQLAIKEKAALYAAYIPLFSEGGIFVPTTRDYHLGMDEACTSLTLPEDTQRYPGGGPGGLGQPHQHWRYACPGRGYPFPER